MKLLNHIVTLKLKSILQIVILNFNRFLDGVADAASWNSVVSILMVMYPSKVSTVMSWTEMLFGFGYMIGKMFSNKHNF